MKKLLGSMAILMAMSTSVMADNSDLGKVLAAPSYKQVLAECGIENTEAMLNLENIMKEDYLKQQGNNAAESIVMLNVLIPGGLQGLIEKSVTFVIYESEGVDTCEKAQNVLNQAEEVK